MNANGLIWDQSVELLLNLKNIFIILNSSVPFQVLKLLRIIITSKGLSHQIYLHV